MEAFVAADRWKLYLSGLGNTLAITLGAICISTVLGMLLCLMKISRYRILRGPAKAYIDVIRGIPVVVQLMFIYFVVLVTWTRQRWASSPSASTPRPIRRRFSAPASLRWTRGRWRRDAAWA